MSVKAESRYEKLREGGIAALEAGRYDEAVEGFRAALEAAEEEGERERVFAARCNLGTAYFARHDYDDAIAGLREIILASRDDRTVGTAALLASMALYKKHRLEKAREYLRVAEERGIRCGWHHLRANTANQLGNVHLMMGAHEEAAEAYTTAIGIYSELPVAAYQRAAALDNRGYVYVLLGRYREGFRDLRQALALAEEANNPRTIASACQDMAYGFIIRNHLQRGEKMALRALGVATKHSFSDIVKNCYFLLMESAIRRDEQAKFDLYFDRLQELFPEVRLSRSFFRMFDITDILNLKEV